MGLLRKITTSLGPGKPRQHPTAPPATELADRLALLDHLRDRGTITDQERETRRTQILQGL
jgi:hypothetical protein